MKYLIWAVIAVLAGICGLVFGWNAGRQNLVDEINQSRERLKRHNHAISYEEDEE